MTTNRELAERRIDKMGFDEHDKEVIFYYCAEGDEHINWLLTATEDEINSWFDAVDTQENE